MENEPLDVTLSDDELFLMLGREIAHDETRLRPPSVSDFITSGKVWFHTHLESLRVVVCRQDILEQLNSEGATLIGAVADLIAAVCTGVSPVTVAILICRRGLKNFCRVE